MTPEAFEVMGRLKRAERRIRARLNEIPVRWEVGRVQFDELVDATWPMMGSAAFVPQPTLVGIPVRIVGPVDAPWRVVSGHFPTIQVRRRDPFELVGPGDPESVPFEVLDEMPVFGSPAGSWGGVITTAQKPKQPADTADLSQVEADLQALAAKQPTAPTAKPAPYPALSSYLNLAMEDSFSKAAAAIAAQLKPLIPAGTYLDVDTGPISLHDELGLKLPDPPLYAPDPDLNMAAAQAVLKAAEQIAAALNTGVLPVPPQAHHATVGEITVHLSVEITKEHAPWKS